MELEIKWTQGDIERKLREELKMSGFRLVEVEDPGKEEGNKPKRPRKKTFQWSYKPNISVRVRAEPDPNATFESPKLEGTLESPMETTKNSDVDEDADIPIPEGTDLLPPGAAVALNEAVKLEREGKAIPRKKMVGESDERPD